jgi:DNA-directed RNA polymerase III subunit RPC3
MLHASLRALAIGRLASEMYPDDEGGGGGGGCGGVVSNSESGGGVNSIVPRHVGAIVCAALAYATRREYAPLDRILGISESEEERHDRMANLGTFGPSDIVPYLPPDVVKSLQSRMGGIHQNLSTLLVRMTKLQYPPVLMEVEEAIGHPGGGKFEVCTRQLLRRMRDRVQHRVLSSHHGIVASRVVSILRDRGHCESDTVAEDAMVPAREAREVLHRLHRDRYVDLFDMHMTKTHNTGTAIFLWDVIPSRLSKTVVDNVCTALLNLRLRRQHEVEVGKDWMDRAKESGSTEENFHEGDKRKFTRFCIGLDRLDRACLSLDETLMVLKDF